VKEFAGSLPSDGHQVHHKGKAKLGFMNSNTDPTNIFGHVIAENFPFYLIP